MIAVFAVSGMPAPADAAEVGGVTLPDEIEVAGEKLVLNGAGVREKYFFGADVYAAGLYLKEPSTDAEQIISADETMALKIHILTGMLDSENFTEATLTGFDESTDGNTAPIQDEIDLFITAFAEEINPNDVFDIQYIPGEGVKVFKNQKSKPAVVVPGMPVKEALFGIWLSQRTEKHLQELRKDLLGK
ncbi:MAG: chalcone isomerase family protein [Desulfobacteraceae bacterium]|nr:chalcone isomerase family protein [Desulfobacteraceae bacterium]MCF8035537.1 chalcone isomerase family protein [Desulfobacteraceae bacterium]